MSVAWVTSVPTQAKSFSPAGRQKIEARAKYQRRRYNSLLRTGTLGTQAILSYCI